MKLSRRPFQRFSLILVVTSLVIWNQNCSSELKAINATQQSSRADDDPAIEPPAPGPIGSGLFVSLPAEGIIEATLHPSSQAVGINNQLVVFGLPLPRGLVNDVTRIRVLGADDQEMPVQVQALNMWRNFGNPAQVISVRSAKITLRRTFASTAPQIIKIQYGVARTQNLVGTFDTLQAWQSISLGPDPTEYPAAAALLEPKVFVTLPAQWMGQSLIQTRTIAVNSDPNSSWFDQAFLTFSNQATTATTAYQTTFEPWLYDRAQTIFIAYFRTGQLNWLRRAHRAAQFYKFNIAANGSFALGGDAKYVYGQSLLYDFMLTGDESILPVIERTLQPHAGWPANFSAATGFWTERNSAYALHAALAAFDASGNAVQANRAQSLFAGYLSMQQTPINGWVKNGCAMHTRQQHDPSEDIPEVMCSPWMGALLADAIWRYYILSENRQALVFLADFADYIQVYGLYNSGGLRLPYYGATSFGTSPPDGDEEHTCDVLGALSRGYWAKKTLGRPTANLIIEVNNLRASCENNLSGASLSPARKFNWWFGTNSDWQWLLSQ